MMGIFHRYFVCNKATLLGHLAHRLCVIVGHHEVPCHRCSKIKKPLMIYFIERIKSLSSAFAGSCVRWVYEIDCVSPPRISTHYFQSVPLNKGDSVTYGINAPDATRQCFWIPARCDTFSILPVLY